MKFLSAAPIIKNTDYSLKNIIWRNHLNNKQKKIQVYTNGYDKDLLKESKSNKYWKDILNNCQHVKEKVVEKGGFFYNNFHIVPENRDEYENAKYPISKSPQSLRTVFVSGFLIPQNKLKFINGGFYINKGQSPSLDEITHKYISKDSYPLLLFNFGYYYTNILLNEKDYGYNKSRKKQRLEEEILSDDCLPFLGASIWREKDKLVLNPPLFNNSFVLFSKEGRILITKNWSLGEGCVNILGKILRWNKTEVNNLDLNSNIQVFTPFLENKKASLSEKWRDYNVFVGNNRVNLLIISKGIGNNPESYIVKIKKGKILMPLMGIVISLDESFFKQNFQDCFPDFDESGFIELKSSIKVKFEVNIPSEIDPKDVTFGYGGFLPLVLEGNNFTESPIKLEKLMFEQGFFHPFSRQSQETPIEKPYEREPRAVLVVIENSDGKEEYGFFSFSGRYENSIGISIFEIIPLLKQILRDKVIKDVIHLDSGSAVKLMYLRNEKDVKILNLTAFSMRSFTGEYTENLYNLISFSV